MKTTQKYYKLIRMPKKPYELQAWIGILESKKRESIIKKIDDTDYYLLIEKSFFSDGTEFVSNIISFSHEYPPTLYEITKNNLIWDYTGFSSPVIHLNKKIISWEDFKNDPQMKQHKAKRINYFSIDE